MIHFKKFTQGSIKFNAIDEKWLENFEGTEWVNLIHGSLDDLKSTEQ